MNASVFCLVSLLGVAGQASARPDFSQSTIVADSTTVVEGDVVAFTMLLRNSGGQSAPGTELHIELPLEAMFVDLAGLEGPAIDPHEKIVTGSLDLPAGGERRVSFRVVVPRDAGGTTLSPSFRLRNLDLATEHSGSARIDVDTRTETRGIRVGGVRFAPAGLALLAILALYPLLYVVVRHRGTRDRGARAARHVNVHGPVIAMVLSVGFWTIFAAMAWRDWRTISAWRQSTCAIVDSRLRAETTTSRPTDAPRRARTRQTTSYKPLLALKYSDDETAIVSTGFDTGSRLGIGGAQRALEDFSRWPIGNTVPCWFDPDDVGDVVVIRGFGGAYLFALFPLPLFIYGLMAIRGRAQYNS